MTITFYNDNGSEEEICSVTLESCPYQVGQSVEIIVDNRDTTTWDVKNHNAIYNITRIEHSIQKTYAGKVHEYVDVIVFLTPKP